MRFKFHLLLSLLVFCSTSILAEAQDIINPSYKRGFAGQIEAGVLFNKGFVGEYSSISSGYNVLPGLFTGVGVGVKNQLFHSISSTKSLHVPAFAHLRYCFLNKTISPFIDLKGGLVFDVSGSVKTMPDSYQDHGTGHFFRIGLGVDYKRFSIYFGDDWAQLSYNNFGASWDDYAWAIGLSYKF